VPSNSEPSPDHTGTEPSPRGAPLPADPSERMRVLRDRINADLQSAVVDRGPSVLYDPIRYVLDGDGKRIRPVLLLLVAHAMGVTVKRAMPAALAVEVFHNFTLVHDDIMDGSDERRGRPTVHTATDRGWETSTAILAGDMMMGLSYELLGTLDAAVDLRRVQDAFYPMVERLCAGQALDEALEEAESVSVDDYLQMIDGKTVALFATVFETGAILGGASDEDRRRLRTAGRDLGRGFQIQDDLLDLVGDQTETGKPVGGDLVNGKKTYVTLAALEAADGDRRAWLRGLLEKPELSASEIDEVRTWMQAAGVFERTRQTFRSYFASAREGLAILPDNPSRKTLHHVIDYTQNRSR